MTNFPFLVSFSGIDGSGKTQHIVLLRRFLRRQGIPYLYIHSVRDSFANRIAKTSPSFSKFLKKGKPESEAETKKSVEKTGISFFSLMVRYITLFFDGLYFRVRLLKWKKNYSVIVLDRYIYDRLVNITYLRGKRKLKFSSFWMKLFPRPNLPLFLSVNPDEAMERKAEIIIEEGQDLNYFEIKYMLFEQGKIEWKLVNIDTSELSISEAKKKILSLFKKRFYRFLRK